MGTAARGCRRRRGASGSREQCCGEDKREGDQQDAGNGPLQQAIVDPHRGGGEAVGSGRRTHRQRQHVTWRHARHRGQPALQHGLPAGPRRARATAPPRAPRGRGLRCQRRVRDGRIDRPRQRDGSDSHCKPGRNQPRRRACRGWLGARLAAGSAGNAASVLCWRWTKASQARRQCRLPAEPLTAAFASAPPVNGSPARASESTAAGSSTGHQRRPPAAAATPTARNRPPLTST